MKEKKEKKARPFDLKLYLIGKLRAATRKCPYFNQAKSERKIKVSVEYTEKEDGTKWLKSTILEEKFGYKVGDVVNTHIYKKAQSRDRVMYCCAECGKLFFDYVDLPKKKGGLKKTSMLAIDHVEPVVSVIDGFAGWDVYIERMFNGKLQILCNYPGEIDGKPSCHHVKTKKEQEERAEVARRKDLTTAARNDNKVIVASETKSKGKK
jgi:hypothetical protein